MNAQSLQKLGALPFHILDRGSWTAYGRHLDVSIPSYQVFTDRKTWYEYWQMGSRRSLPEVNFDNYFVIFITLGKKLSGGHYVGIDSVDLSLDESDVPRIQVTLEIDEPVPGQGVDLGETNPFILAQVESSLLVNQLIRSGKMQLNFVDRHSEQTIPFNMLLGKHPASSK